MRGDLHLVRELSVWDGVGWSIFGLVGSYLIYIYIYECNNIIEVVGSVWVRWVNISLGRSRPISCGLVKLWPNYFSVC